MSGPLINRSLTTIRTELEFLHDSEVITEGLYNKLLAALPQKYQKDSPAWGVDKLQTSNGDLPSYSAPDKLAQELSSTHISSPAPSAVVVRPSPPPVSSQPVGYCKVLYDYASQESDDISLGKGDKVAVIEHLSEDWWKGYKKSNPEKTGVFPSNYVSVISEQEFNMARSAAPQPEEKQYLQTYPQQQMQPQHSGNSYQQQQPMQNSYGGYAQYPPPSTNYYQQPPPQQQQVQQVQVEQQQPHKESQLKKIGGKFGNAAIFGAGATLGGDIINSIF